MKGPTQCTDRKKRILHLGILTIICLKSKRVHLPYFISSPFWGEIVSNTVCCIQLEPCKSAAFISFDFLANTDYVRNSSWVIS